MLSWEWIACSWENPQPSSPPSSRTGMLQTDGGREGLSACPADGQASGFPAPGSTPGASSSSPRLRSVRWSGLHWTRKSGGPHKVTRDLWFAAGPCRTGQNGTGVDRKTVASSMCRQGVEGIVPRRFRSVTPLGDTRVHAIPDLIARRCDTGVLDAVWTSDITYCEPARAGCTYVLSGTPAGVV